MESMIKERSSEILAGKTEFFPKKSFQNVGLEIFFPSTQTWRQVSANGYRFTHKVIEILFYFKGKAKFRIQGKGSYMYMYT